MSSCPDTDIDPQFLPEFNNVKFIFYLLKVFYQT